ncbi:SCO family protein [Massilia sp. TN1-12]|uniref:SCO family protein n=1 Tax=Massilia paldalensis TaxID=3377675 RepID=UPI00384E1805
MKLRVLATSALLACAMLPPVASAQALALPPPPDVAFDPRPGTRLPLDAVLRDEAGRDAPLGARFGRVPVVLVPGYYRCTSLCGTLFEGVLQALALSGMKAGEYVLVGVSIDPREDGAAARARLPRYAALLPGGGADIALLTGAAPQLARIERALGYRAVPDAGGGQIAHAAGFVVAAPDGRIVRFFPGVRFDPAGVRAAVQAARAYRIDPAPSFGQRLALLCAHIDPAAGRHSGAALAAVRGGALLVLALLGTWIWRRRARGGVA